MNHLERERIEPRLLTEGGIMSQEVAPPMDVDACCGGGASKRRLEENQSDTAPNEPPVTKKPRVLDELTKQVCKEA